MSDFLAAFAALRAEYEAGLPGLIRELGALVEAAAVDATALPGACRAAHRLRGTAGSYGFEALGEAAGRIEDALEQGMDGVPGMVRALEALAPQPTGPGPATGAANSSGRSK